MKYGYARVSTNKQGKFGTSLDEQENKLRNAGAEVIFREEYTATKADRPQLQKLLEQIHEGDSFCVCKMDRFARNTQDALALIENLQERKIFVHILNIGIIDDSSTGKLTLTILAAFAEYERDMIIERTQAGRAIHRLDPDYREGRKPKFSHEHVNNAIQLLESKSFTQVANMTGISKSTLIREIKKRKLNKALS